MQIVLPKWSTQVQVWLFEIFLFVADPVVLPQISDLFSQSISDAEHSLTKIFSFNLQIIRKPLQVLEYRYHIGQQPSSLHHEGSQMRDNITSTLRSGWTSVIKQQI